MIFGKWDAKAENDIKEKAMGIMHVNRLEPGMTLAEDVKDRIGRFLLGRGQKIEPGHLRILKIWGVAEVDVTGHVEVDEDTCADTQLDPEALARIEEELGSAFRHVELAHPAMEELFRLAVRDASDGGGREAPKGAASLRENVGESVEEKVGEAPISFDARELLGGKAKLPELSSVAYELEEVATNPYCSFEDMARVVGKSPGLTVKLLQIVNSPFYGFPRQIDTISKALTIIGTKELTILVWGLTVLSTFKGIRRDVVDMASFLEHSLACGTISRILGAHKNLPHTEKLFVSGLLHDIGRLMLCSQHPEDALRVLDRAQETGLPLLLVERKFLGLDHAEIGGALLEKWRLPTTLEDMVAFHHEPAKARNPVSATILHASDVIAHAMGLGESGEKLVPPFDGEAWDKLGLSPGLLDTVVKQTRHQLSAVMKPFLRLVQ